MILQRCASLKPSRPFQCSPGSHLLPPLHPVPERYNVSSTCSPRADLPLHPPCWRRSSPLPVVRSPRRTHRPAHLRRQFLRSWRPERRRAESRGWLGALFIIHQSRTSTIFPQGSLYQAVSHASSRAWWEIRRVFSTPTRATRSRWMTNRARTSTCAPQGHRRMTGRRTGGSTCEGNLRLARGSGGG